jgi:hypothetical protein
MILQMEWNECVRFGGHINIQVSFNILQLEVLKKALSLHNPTVLKRGCFEAVLDSTRAQVFRS